MKIDTMTTDEIKIWYYNAVKSDLILNFGLMPDEAELVILKYKLHHKLDLYTDIQLHDDPQTVTRDMLKKGLIHMD